MTMIRTSERRDFKRCPQRWYWGWRQGYKPWRDANPLWFGQGIHLALAEWYLKGRKRGPHPIDTWVKFVGDEERFIPTDYEEDEYKYEEAKQLGVDMLRGYVDLYGKDESWFVISTEQTFSFDVPGTHVTYKGTFDGVYKDLGTNEIWLMEHKTAKAIFLNHLPLDDQAGAYFAIATETLRKQDLIGRDEYLSGIMYNFLRKGKPDDRPKNEKGLALNKDGTISKRQASPLYLREPVWRSEGEREGIIRGIKNEAMHMDAVRRKELPLFKNPTRDCSWDCSFYRMCMLHEASEDWKEYAEAEFRREDPYADHRENRKSASS